VPFTRPDGVVVDRDEHLRPQTTLAALERRDRRYGAAAVSEAAGLGVAVLVERVAS